MDIACVVIWKCTDGLDPGCFPSFVRNYVYLNEITARARGLFLNLLQF